MATWPGPSEERPSTKHVYCSRIELQLSSATIVYSCEEEKEKEKEEEEEEKEECYKLRTAITVNFITCIRKIERMVLELRLHIIEETNLA